MLAVHTPPRPLPSKRQRIPPSNQNAANEYKQARGGKTVPSVVEYNMQDDAELERLTIKVNDAKNRYTQATEELQKLQSQKMKSNGTFEERAKQITLRGKLIEEGTKAYFIYPSEKEKRIEKGKEIEIEQVKFELEMRPSDVIRNSDNVNVTSKTFSTQLSKIIGPTNNFTKERILTEIERYEEFQRIPRAKIKAEQAETAYGVATRELSEYKANHKTGPDYEYIQKSDAETDSEISSITPQQKPEKRPSLRDQLKIVPKKIPSDTASQSESSQGVSDSRSSTPS